MASIVIDSEMELFVPFLGLEVIKKLNTTRRIFLAKTKGGSQFHIEITGKNHEVVLTPYWGVVTTVKLSCRQCIKESKRLSEENFLEKEKPLAPLCVNTASVDALKKIGKFLERLDCLWRKAEYFRKQAEQDADRYEEFVSKCESLRVETKGGYKLAPKRVDKGGSSATFEIEIPASKIVQFYQWCEDNNIERDFLKHR